MKLRRSRTFGPRTSLTDQQVWMLATYNAERARGLVHTPAYDELMDQLQQRFDADTLAAAHIFEATA